MLSSAEIDFLLGRRPMNSNLKKVLKHRIKTKFLAFQQADLPAILGNEWSRELWLQVTGNVNRVNNVVNPLDNHGCSASRINLMKRRGRDSNPCGPHGPLALKASALINIFKFI